MLILSRKIDQKIKIGDNITLTIIDIHSDQVKVGVDAPRTISVYREEIFSAIKNENAAAIIPSKDELNAALDKLVDRKKGAAK